MNVPTAKWLQINTNEWRLIEMINLENAAMLKDHQMLTG